MNGINLLLKAILFAAHKHQDQRRKHENASSYISHPIEVAEILANERQMKDLTTLLAAVLHDTGENIDFIFEEMEEELVFKKREYFWGVGKVVEECKGFNVKLEYYFDSSSTV